MQEKKKSSLVLGILSIIFSLLFCFDWTYSRNRWFGFGKFTSKRDPNGL